MSKRRQKTVRDLRESDFTSCGKQTRVAKCSLQYIPRHWYDFSRIWSSRKLTGCLARIFPRRVFLSPFRNNSAPPTSSPQQAWTLFAIRGLILESVRNVEKPTVKNPERLLRGDRCWATARRISRRFCCCCCCFRAKAIAKACASAPSLHGSPSPTWFTFSYSAESAGRRCTSRLSAPLGRRAAFSHRLVVARFTAFLDTDSTHVY